MAKAIAGIVVIFLTMGSSGPVLAGGWTSHGFVYKPSLGARGTVEKGLYDSGQDRVDARLSKEIWVGDPNYGTTIQGALTAISGNQAILRVPAGTHNLSANLIVPSNVTLRVEQGATLAIPQGVTLTINGGLEAVPYQIFACTGTGKVVFGSPHKVKELNAFWWGATGLGIVDDQPAIQRMIDCSLASHSMNMYIPAGTYTILDTIKLGYGDGTRFYGTLRGDNSKDSYGTVIDATGFGDRPAINFQGCYRPKVTDLYIVGKNLAPGTMSISPPRFKPLVTDWISAGCNYYRYAPYAGITVDAYRGTAPNGSPGNEPYPNDVYGRDYSTGVVLERVRVLGFVAGIVLSPNNIGDQDDSFSAYDCWVERCAFGFSSGGSQSRALNFYNPMFMSNWCALSDARFGAQDGNTPSFYGGIIQQGWKMFEFHCISNPATFEGVHTENLVWLGERGLHDDSWKSALVFNGCELGRSTNNTYQSPFWLIAHANVQFNGCNFTPHQQNDQAQVWNIVGSGKVAFNACSYNNCYDTSTRPTFMGVQLSGENLTQCRYRDMTDAIIANYNQMQTVSVLGAKYFIGQTALQVFTGNTSTLYKISRLNQYGVATALFDVAPTLSGATMGSTLSFTAHNADDFKNGDIICWRVAQPVIPATTNVIPAFIVTNKVGSVITATSLFDGIDGAYVPSSLYVATSFFYNGVESTGNTHSNTTVDNVTTVANWAIGDWIRGSGIPNDTRIVNIVGTTITLSKAATATASGVALYNCRLTPM